MHSFSRSSYDGKYDPMGPIEELSAFTIGNELHCNRSHDPSSGPSPEGSSNNTLVGIFTDVNTLVVDNREYKRQ